MININNEFNYAPTNNRLAYALLAKDKLMVISQLADKEVPKGYRVFSLSRDSTKLVGLLNCFQCAYTKHHLTESTLHSVHVDIINGHESTEN